MWQLETEATKASSGSTAAALEYGAGTTDGEADAGTTWPPSKLQLCARVNFPCSEGFVVRLPAHGRFVLGHAPWSSSAPRRRQARRPAS